MWRLGILPGPAVQGADAKNRTVQVTPLGIKFVEDNLPLEIAA